MTATAADYLWFAERYPDLSDAFCLTLARDLAPAEVLRRMGTRETTDLAGVDEVCRHYYASAAPRGYPSLLVAATVMDGWTLAVEPNGFQGVTDEIVTIIKVAMKRESVYRHQAPTPRSNARTAATATTRAHTGRGGSEF